MISGVHFIARARKSFSRIAFALLLLFTFLAPLKFGLPYTYNIDQSVPQNLSEAVFFSWPAEWGVLLLGLIAFFVLLSIKWENKRIREYSLPDLMVIFWILSVLISFIFHGAGKGGLQTSVLFCSYGLYYFLIQSLSSGPKRRFLLFMTGVVSLVICAAYGFYQHHEGLDETLRRATELNLPELENPVFLSRLKSKKIFSTFIYSNSLAGYLILWIPLVFASVINRKTRKYFFLSLLTGGGVFLCILTLLIQKFQYIPVYLLHLALFPFSILYLLVLTRSKGALITLILSLFAVLFIQIYRKKSRWGWGLLFLLVLSCLVSRLPYFSRFMPSMKVRIEYNTATLDMIRQAPLLGNGPGSYGTQYMHFKRPGAEEVQLAHNDFFQLWAECGFFSFLFFLCLHLFIFRDLILMNRGSHAGFHHDAPSESSTVQIFNPWALFLAFTCSLIHHFVDFDLYVPALGYVLFYFFSFAAIQANETKKQYFILKKGTLLGTLILALTALFCMIALLIRVSLSLSYHEIGMRMIQNGKCEKSIPFIKEAICQYPYSIAYHVHLADCLTYLEEYQEAEKYYLKALDISPDHAMTWYKYASCLIRKDQKTGSPRANKVLTALSNASKYYPANEEIRKQLRHCQNWLKQKFHPDSAHAEPNSD
ncbi:MAG: O-antigen ligase family protein [Candidatus Aureabacteria bacterium]|nr:O-antigen ligase family protein [Candidatus Auribacterota bacterium]